ncbi:collagen alpha-1(III) chain-like [Cervus canadensis]|uniref:collagen alpha-1(III) chain-like n=1 Tax=Cervus canadensis TaxID=1574408 RepID=UPI001C9E88BA|nr:collagen alpha-1(III) chain-like [Cervus canadensis]
MDTFAKGQDGTFQKHPAPAPPPAGCVGSGPPATQELKRQRAWREGAARQADGEEAPGAGWGGRGAAQRREEAGRRARGGARAPRGPAGRTREPANARRAEEAPLSAAALQPGARARRGRGAGASAGAVTRSAPGPLPGKLRGGEAPATPPRPVRAASLSPARAGAERCTGSRRRPGPSSGSLCSKASVATGLVLCLLALPGTPETPGPGSQKVPVLEGLLLLTPPEPSVPGPRGALVASCPFSSTSCAKCLRDHMEPVTSEELHPKSGPHVIITSPLNVEEGAEVSVRVMTCEEDWPLLSWKVEGTISHRMLQPQEAGKGVETGSPQDSRKEHIPADILIFAQ